MTDALAYAQALLKCPSVTPEDAGAQDVIINALKPLGFEIHDVTRETIRNTFLRLGTGGPHICFAGHTDVVPAGDLSSWHVPPFEGEVKNGMLYGRGAADMKGNIACVMAAVELFIKQHGAPDGSFSLLITGDEEAEAVNGTQKVLEWMSEEKHIPDVCLVCEPTNPEYLGQEVKIGRRGSLSGHITVRGKQGHVAYPDLADNPLPGLVKLLDALSSAILDRGSAYFPPTSVQITTIDVGNTAMNVIPAQGRASFNIRFNDRWTAATLEAKLREILGKTGVSYILKTSSNAESFLTPPGEWSHLVIAAVEDVTGHKPVGTTFGGTSDARFVQKYCPVVEFGLVNKTIHQIDEHVAVADLETLTKIYLKILEKYFL